MLQTTFEMPDDKKREALSKIAKLMNLGQPGNFEPGNYDAASKLVWEESRTELDYKTWRHQLHAWPNVNKKADVAEKKSTIKRVSKAIGIHYDVYIEFYRAFCDKYQWVPDDKTMNMLAGIGGWSKSVAGATRAGLENMGYEFKRTHDGFIVTLPISLSELQSNIDTLKQKETDLKEEYKTTISEIKKWQKILKQRGASSAA